MIDKEERGEKMSMESRCQEGKYGCKYSGDLYEICPTYCLGYTENGDKIFARKDFPLYCKDCNDRDSNFCLRYKDLICFNELDPFNCKADLLNDELYGIELAKKRDEALKNACFKRNVPYKEPN
jgi:hypothetical protein